MQPLKKYFYNKVYPQIIGEKIEQNRLSGKKVGVRPLKKSIGK